jgi:hypothetical protein
MNPFTHRFCFRHRICPLALLMFSFMHLPGPRQPISIPATAKILISCELLFNRHQLHLCLYNSLLVILCDISIMSNMDLGALSDEYPPITEPIRPPPRGYEIDEHNRHISLENFGKRVQQAANAVFPNDTGSRYTDVFALLLSWEDEDPRLPVSLEIDQLNSVLEDLYGFKTGQWKIPPQSSHNKTSRKILDFIGDDNREHLKIVYYAGHGKLTSNGQSAWTRYGFSLSQQCIPACSYDLPHRFL